MFTINESDSFKCKRILGIAAQCYYDNAIQNEMRDPQLAIQRKVSVHRHLFLLYLRSDLRNYLNVAK